MPTILWGMSKDCKDPNFSAETDNERKRARTPQRVTPLDTVPRNMRVEKILNGDYHFKANKIILKISPQKLVEEAKQEEASNKKRKIDKSVPQLFNPGFNQHIWDEGLEGANKVIDKDFNTWVKSQI